MTGIVHLVGAGPGDSELLTLRAVRLLEGADVVLVDRLVGPDVLRHVGPGADVIEVGKSPGDDQDAAQSMITDLMIDRAARGEVVVRLKGGDPMVFGRANEEIESLTAAGIEVQVTPGVSSILAAAASARFSLTQRGIASAFAVVTGTAKDTLDWTRYAPVDTLVILMGVAQRVQIANDLINAGRPPGQPVLFVESASLSTERIAHTTLGKVAAGEVTVTNPAVWVIGDTATSRP